MKKLGIGKLGLIWVTLYLGASLYNLLINLEPVKNGVLVKVNLWKLSYLWKHGFQTETQGNRQKLVWLLNWSSRKQTGIGELGRLELQEADRNRRACLTGAPGNRQESASLVNRNSRKHTGIGELGQLDLQETHRNRRAWSTGASGIGVLAQLDLKETDRNRRAWSKGATGNRQESACLVNRSFRNRRAWSTGATGNRQKSASLLNWSLCFLFCNMQNYLNYENKYASMHIIVFTKSRICSKERQQWKECFILVDGRTEIIDS